MSVETSTAEQVFAHVLVGIDGSDAGRAAAVQAGRLVAPTGTLELATAIYLVDASLQHWPDERVTATLEREGGPRLEAAAAAAGARATTRLLNGPPKQALLEEAKRYGATLIALGTHGHSRLSELLVGGVTGPVLRDAACSILVARPSANDAVFPRSIAVGIDGSPSSLAALSVAEYLATRFRVPLRAVRAVGDLLGAGDTTDLIVVGSRGRHGLGALGSVSERVAHEAQGSVLVVRLRPGT